MRRYQIKMKVPAVTTKVHPFVGEMRGFVVKKPGKVANGSVSATQNSIQLYNASADSFPRGRTNHHPRDMTKTLWLRYGSDFS